MGQDPGQVGGYCYFPRPEGTKDKIVTRTRERGHLSGPGQSASL